MKSLNHLLNKIDIKSIEIYSYYLMNSKQRVIKIKANFELKLKFIEEMHKNYHKIKNKINQNINL